MGKWFFFLFLSAACVMEAVGPYQVVIIPAAENTANALTSQGQMRAAYLVGFLLRPHANSPVSSTIINMQKYPLADFFVMANSTPCMQTIIPLFHEGNYYSIETNNTQTITLQTINKQSLPNLLQQIFQNSAYNEKTVVVCIEISHMSQLFKNYQSTPIGQNGVFKIINGSTQVINYTGVPLNGFATW